MTIPHKPNPGDHISVYLQRWYVETLLDFKTLDPRVVEIVLSLYQILFGSWLLIWNTVYTTAPAIYHAISYLPERTWGLILLMMGILQYHASVIKKNDIALRRITIWPTAVIFGIMSGSFLRQAVLYPSFWPVFGTPFYTATTMLALWVWWRLWSKDHRSDFFDRLSEQLENPKYAATRIN